MAQLVIAGDFQEAFFKQLAREIPNIDLDRDWLRFDPKTVKVLVVRAQHQIDAAFLDRCPSLRMILMQGSGLDHIDLAEAKNRGIQVKSYPGLNAIAAAEWTLLSILALSRNLISASRDLQQGNWRRDHWRGHEIFGKTLGLIGCGAVGSAVAERAKALGMKIMAVDPYLSPARWQELELDSSALTDTLEQSDFVSLHIPLTPETHQWVSADFLKRMKAAAYLVNTSRGAVVVEADLLSALDRGTIAGAVLDVFLEEPLKPEHPFLRHPKIFCSPHLAGQTFEAQERLQQAILKDLVAFFREK